MKDSRSNTLEHLLVGDDAQPASTRRWSTTTASMMSYGWPRKRELVRTALSLVVVLALAPGAAAGTPEVQVRVDPRVELMSVIFRLAGNPEYNQPRVPSYAKAVDEHFADHKDHAVIQLARKLRRTRGVSFDAVMSMAVHLKDARTLGEAVPLDPRPASLDQRWKPHEVRAFRDAARRFAHEAEFQDFFDKHTALYEHAVSGMKEVLARDAKLDWIEGFFGVPPKASFQLTLGLLNGGACYGPRVLHPDGREDIHCVLGVWLTDAEGQPRFDRSVLPIVVHEFCHSYCNPLVDAHAESLRPAGQRLWPAVAEQMKQQAYADWKTMMYESVVRAAVVRYMAAAEGEAGRRKQAADDKQRGFLWIDELSSLLASYEKERARYKTLSDLMPRVVAVLDSYADELDKQDKHRPKVVSLIPANGADDVDPALAAIQVTFDRPMLDGNWSFVGGGPNFPKVTGKPSFDGERRTLTLPVELKPDWSYEFWLNRGRFSSFRSAEGVPLRSVHVTFRTRKAR